MSKKKSNNNGRNGKNGDNESFRPGSCKNPLPFKGAVACRSELLSNCVYQPNTYVYAGRGVYLITSSAQECSGTYQFSYSAKPIRAM